MGRVMSTDSLVEDSPARIRIHPPATDTARTASTFFVFSVSLAYIHAYKYTVVTMISTLLSCFLTSTIFQDESNNTIQCLTRVRVG